MSIGDARQLSLSQTFRTSRATVEDLSDDVLGEVAGFLTPSELTAFSLACRRFASVGNSDAVWGDMLARDFGSAAPSSSSTSSSSLAARVPSSARIPRPGSVGRETSRYAAAAVAMSSLGASTRTALGRMVPSGTAQRLRSGMGMGVGVGMGNGVNNTALLDRRTGLPARSNSIDAALLPPTSSSAAYATASSRTGANTGASKTGASTMTNPKELYQLKFSGVVQQRAVQKVALQAVAVNSAAAGRARKLRVLLDVSGYWVGLGLPLACVAVWMLLLTLKLSETMSDLSWNSVFVPIWVGLIACAASLFVSCMTSCFSRCCRGPSSTCYKQTDGDEYTPFGFLVAWWEAAKSGVSGCFAVVATSWLFLFVLLGFVIFPICLWAKLSGRVDPSWAVIFLPVWFIFLLYCCVPCCCSKPFEELTGDNDDSIWGGWGVSLVALWAPLLATLAMVVARLEGKTIAASLLFIPLWIVDACLLLFAVVIAIVAATDDDEEASKKEWRTCGLMAFLLAMWLPAQITAAVFDAKYGHLSPLGFCLPILLGLIVVAVAGCWAAARLLRLSRRDNFSDTYRWESWTKEPSRGGAGILPGTADPRAVRDLLVGVGGEEGGRRTGGRGDDLV